MNATPTAQLALPIDESRRAGFYLTLGCRREQLASALWEYHGPHC